MIDFTKKECIRVFESFDYKYLGFNDIGWGEKFYVFELPPDHTVGEAYVTYKLGEMRRKAYRMDSNRWLQQQSS